MNLSILIGMFNLGGGEIFLIMAVLLLMFGGKKLPELARGLGKGIKEFKDATKGETNEAGAAEENKK